MFVYPTECVVLSTYVETLVDYTTAISFDIVRYVRCRLYSYCIWSVLICLVVMCIEMSVSKYRLSYLRRHREGRIVIFFFNLYCACTTTESETTEHSTNLYVNLSFVCLN